MTFKVIAPLDALATFIPVLDFIKEVPSARFVKDPEKPNEAVTNPADWRALAVLSYVRSVSPAKEPPSLNCICVLAPPGVPLPPPPVEDIVICPLEADAIVILLPATRYDDPSVSFWSDPEREFSKNPLSAKSPTYAKALACAGIFDELKSWRNNIPL